MCADLRNGKPEGPMCYRTGGRAKQGGPMAKKDVEAIVSASGMMSEVWWKLVKAVKERGGSAENIHRLATPAGDELINKFAELVVGVAPAAASTFKVIVDYDKSLKDMISAGKYDQIGSDVTEKHFPISGNGKAEVNLELVRLNKRISSKDAIVELKKLGTRPATLPELLAFGVAYPEEQRKLPIVALGSVWQDWDGDRCVPCLYCWVDGERSLDLYCFGGVWDEPDRFLAVRES